MFKWLLLLALTPAALAQTYTTSTPFYCDANGHYPPTSFSQFNCRGILYYVNGDTYPNYDAELFFGAVNIVWTKAFGATNPYTTKTALTKFTQPVNGQPGTLAFNWSGLDASGSLRIGTFSATWTSKNVCGGKTCWYHPVLLTTVLVVD